MNDEADRHGVRVRQINKNIMNKITNSAHKCFLSVATLLLISAPLFAVAASTIPRSTLTVPTQKCVNGVPEITLDWSNVQGAKYYTVFKNTKPSSTWKNILSKNTQSMFIDKNAVSGATYQYQIKTHFASSTAVSYSNITSVKTTPCTTTPPTTPTTPTSPATGEITFEAFITGYGWPDNTPASANISHGVIHTQAGGIGSFADPITIAVGHSILNGKDILDYPAGTKFYIPALRKYFIVEDTCGDGNTPQNGPCHSGYQGKVWLDAWVGGQGASASSVYACEDKITDFHTVIQNPSASYAVISGPIFNVTCASLFSEVPVSN